VANATRLASSLPVDASVGRRRCLALLAPAAQLAGLCEREGITHVHCHTCGDGAIVAMLAQGMGGVPYSITINANLDWWGGALEEKLGRAAFTVSTMRWVQKDVQARFARAIADRCHYAPVGVDTDTWRPEPRRVGSPGEPLRLLCIGRLHRSKGFDVALHALRQVLDAGRAARLTILGSGPEAQALAALAAGLGLGTQVDFAGSMPEDEVRQALAGADIFLLPSHAEPLGVVVMEAMAMAVPVIVTRAGGVAETSPTAWTGSWCRLAIPRHWRRPSSLSVTTRSARRPLALPADARWSSASMPGWVPASSWPCSRADHVSSSRRRARP
jgi:glycosyltransferase involved in cell wall biosynthesis